MGTKTFSPFTKSRRHMTSFDFADITKSTPEKSLLAPLSKKAGRNNYGQITIRHKGGGHKRRYRLVDFGRFKLNVTANVVGVEYDPNRTARIALLQYVDGDKAYVLAPVGLNVGDKVIASKDADIKPGNSLPLGVIPVGSSIHNIEIRPGKGGQMVRAAGALATVVGREEEGKYVIVRLPSGELRKILAVCQATVGQVGNLDNENIKLGKAGANRWKGKRPTVRGMSMNPVDHPLGGGEGRGKGHHPVSPWGQKCKGYKTRDNKSTDKFIVRRRNAK